jgi:hypothetical protein
MPRPTVSVHAIDQDATLRIRGQMAAIAALLPRPREARSLERLRRMEGG